MKITTTCRDLTIKINQVKFLAHLNTLNMLGLDTILGMDWLTQLDSQCSWGWYMRYTIN
jgi:hypothetical protein